MLIVGVLGAVVAAFLGWFAGGFYLTDRNQVLMLHRWLGTAIAGAGFVLLYLSATARRTPEKPRTAYWIALALMTIAIAIQGYIGGSFMHGGMRHMAF
jgi:heme A synthase